MVEKNTDLNLINVSDPDSTHSVLIGVTVTQGELSVSYTNLLKRVFIRPSDKVVAIVYGEPNDEPYMQTFSYRHEPTEIQLFFADLSALHHPPKTKSLKLPRLT